MRAWLAILVFAVCAWPLTLFALWGFRKDFGFLLVIFVLVGIVYALMKAAGLDHYWPK